MDEEEKGRKGGDGGGVTESAERRLTGDATKEEEEEEAEREEEKEEEEEERKRLMKGSAPETASAGPQTVRPKSGSPTGSGAPTTPGNQEPRLPSSSSSSTSSAARRSFRLDYRHEEEVTHSQKDSSGRFVNPWPTWRFPSYVTILRLFITEKNHSNVPSSKEVLDKELPILEPFFVRSPQVSPSPVSLPAGQLRATWLGHATVLVEMDGLTILTDPMFSQRASPLPLVGPKRYRDAPCSVDQLPHVDAVLISHNHYDHLDWASVVALERRFGPELRWLVPLGLLDWMHGCGCQNVIQLDWWEQNCVPGHDEVTFVCTPAQHWCKRTPLDDNRALWGSWTVLGPSCRFFFAGDTGYCSSFAEIGRRYGPFDLAAIPIGAYLPRSIMRSQHVDPEEAVKIHIDVQAKHSLAIHWGTFALAYEGMAVLKNEPRDLGQSQLQNQQSNQRTIQEVTEWLRARAENQSNVEKEEDAVQQNVVRIKEEEDDYGYPCSQSNGTWIPTEQSTSSSADNNAELEQEEEEDEDEMQDMAPSLSSERSLFPSHPARGWLESLAAFPSFSTAGPEMEMENGRPLHRCPVCGRGFSRRSSMKRHLQGVHKGEDPSSHHPDSSASLSAKIKTEPMQEGDEDEMQDMAPSLSSERSLFPSHPARGWLESLAAFPSFSTAGPEMEVENGRPLHRCPVCGRGFSRRSSMKRHHEGVHKRNHTNTSSLRPVHEAADTATEQPTSSSSSADINTEPMEEEDETLASALSSETSHSPPDPASGPQESSSSYAIPSCTAGGPDSDVADNARRHKCPVCGKGFSRRSTMRRHQEGVHKDGKPYIPPTHTGKRSFDCEQCGKSFQHAQQLVTHERVHTGEKPFICGDCGKSFSQSGSLKAHLRTHTECGKSFSQSGSLKAHLRTHTGERPYPCPHCDKNFSHAFNLTAHMRTHTGERPYQCSDCGKRFSQLGPLRTHQRTHTGERPYSCQVCGRRFADLGHATRHQRTHREPAGMLLRVAEEEDAAGSPLGVGEEEDGGSPRDGEEEEGGSPPGVGEEEDGGSPPGVWEEEEAAGSPRVTEEEEASGLPRVTEDAGSPSDGEEEESPE